MQDVRIKYITFGFSVLTFKYGWSQKIIACDMQCYLAISAKYRMIAAASQLPYFNAGVTKIVTSSQASKIMK